MTGQPIDDWTALAGLTVQIRKDGRLVRVGHVETVTPTADVLWLQGQGVEPRTLFQKTEGYRVWSLPDASMPIEHIYSDGKGERILLPVPGEWCPESAAQQDCERDDKHERSSHTP